METIVHMIMICRGLTRYELRPKHAIEFEGAAFPEFRKCGGLRQVVANDRQNEETYPRIVMSIDEGLCDEGNEFMQHGRLTLELEALCDNWSWR